MMFNKPKKLKKSNYNLENMVINEIYNLNVYGFKTYDEFHNFCILNEFLTSNKAFNSKIYCALTNKGALLCDLVSAAFIFNADYALEGNDAYKSNYDNYYDLVKFAQMMEISNPTTYANQIVGNEDTYLTRAINDMTTYLKDSNNSGYREFEEIKKIYNDDTAHFNMKILYGAILNNWNILKDRVYTYKALYVMTKYSTNWNTNKKNVFDFFDISRKIFN